MKQRSKRFRKGLEGLDLQKDYSIEEAVQVLKSFPRTKFDEAVEIAIKLEIDAKQADQIVRGSFSLPHGLGKQMRVIAFVDDARVEDARKAGAVAAGGKELADKIKDGNWFEFDVAVAEPKMMRVVGALGKVLGPKGLMPSPKSGTVVNDPVAAIKEFVAGKQEYRNDANGNVHFVAGRLSFDAPKLVDNLTAFFKHIQAVKPSGVHGNYITNVCVTSSMGPGLRIAFQR